MAVDNGDKPKFYGLIEFPYPSGAGMHVGHIKAYSSLEVISRKRRMEGYNVLFPIGFDCIWSADGELRDQDGTASAEDHG